MTPALPEKDDSRESCLSYSAPLAPLCDRHGRIFDYARFAIIEQCNLRCVYCLPEDNFNFQQADKLLTQQEILRTIRLLADMGVTKIRFTGGEPLLRRDLVDIIAATRDIAGIKTIHLTTNGVLFPKYAHDLYAAGLDGVNISLDTLIAERFKKITRRKHLDKVLHSIALANEIGFATVKINVVVIQGCNDDEIFDFCELSKDYNNTIRFIELMPFDAQQIWDDGAHMLSAEKLVTMIKGFYADISTVQGTRTEHYIFKAAGYRGKIAVIPAYTRKLCGDCTRIRITADGNIMNCLYSNKTYSIRQLLRNQCSDKDLELLFRKAFDEKPKTGFEAEKENIFPIDIKSIHTDQLKRSSMTQIGG